MDRSINHQTRWRGARALFLLMLSLLIAAAAELHAASYTLHPSRAAFDYALNGAPTLNQDFSGYLPTPVNLSGVEFLPGVSVTSNMRDVTSFGSMGNVLLFAYGTIPRQGAYYEILLTGDYNAIAFDVESWSPYDPGPATADVFFRDGTSASLQFYQTGDIESDPVFFGITSDALIDRIRWSEGLETGYTVNEEVGLDDFAVARLATPPPPERILPLTDRGGGLIYDPDLRVTWLKDANYARTSGRDSDGLMTYEEANAWVGGLTYQGYSDWRLPSALNPDGTLCTGYNCTESEIGHLYYIGLRNSAGDGGFRSAGPFLNMDDPNGTYLAAAAPTGLYKLSLNPGEQLLLSRDDLAYTLPVRDGDSTVNPASQNTPGGRSVSVTPRTGVGLRFDTVSSPGISSVSTVLCGLGTEPSQLTGGDDLCGISTTPDGYRPGTQAVWHEITTTALYSGPIEVTIDYDERRFTSERRLRLLHFPDRLEGLGTSPGSYVPEDITTSIDTASNRIRGVTMGLSPFIVVEEVSTAVTLQNFSAHLDGNQVTLSWSTSFEIDNEGFIILRGDSPGGPFTPITQGMIPAMGGGFKAAYTFTDGNVEQGKTYYYRLQDIDSRGRVTAHRVIPATVAEAKASGESQENVSKEDNTTSASQQTAATTGVVALQINSGLPPTLVLPHKGGGDEEGESVALTSDERQDAEIEISSLRSVQALPLGTASPRNDSSSHPHSFDFAQDRPASPIKGEEYSESYAATTGVVALHTLPNPGPSSFSVSIEDDKGNIIVVSKIEDTAGTATQTSGSGFTKESGRDRQAGGQSDRPEGLSLQVKEESGRIVLTWQGRGGLKGFILHRAEKGKDNYTPISNLIPYFGRDDKDIFLYRFTDNSAKSGFKYEYRLEKVEADHKADLKIGKLSE